MASFQVFSQSLGDFGTNAYFLVKEKKALAIDAPPGSYQFYKNLIELHGFEFKTLLLTHSHFDHIADAGKIQKLGIKIGVHRLDAPNCIHPGVDGLPLMVPVDPFSPDFYFDSECVELEGFMCQIVQTPGHTPGGCCFIFDQVLFSGDTLFKGSIGNLTFPGCDPQLMRKSLEKLLSIKEDLTVYPGHGPKTTLRKEEANLKYFIQSI